MRDMREMGQPLLAACRDRAVPRARGHVRKRDDVDDARGVRPGAPAVLDVRAPRLLCVIL